MRCRGALLLAAAACVALGADPASAAGNLLQSLMGSGGGGAGSLLGPLASGLFGGSSGAPAVTYVMAPSVSYAYAPPPPRLPPPPSVTRYLPPPPSIGAPPMRAPSAYLPPPPPPDPVPARASLPLQSASHSIAAARQVKECRHGQWSGDNGELVVGTACLGPDGWVLY